MKIKFSLVFYLTLLYVIFPLQVLSKQGPAKHSRQVCVYHDQYSLIMSYFKIILTPPDNSKTFITSDYFLTSRKNQCLPISIYWQGRTKVQIKVFDFVDGTAKDNSYSCGALTKQELSDNTEKEVKFCVYADGRNVDCKRC